MAGKKVLLITKVNVIWSSLGEFNKYWEKENLPFWLENGAKHIGSFVNYLGGPKNQILRLFEFEDLSQWGRFMKLREKMFDSEQGRQGLQKTLQFVESIEETVWVSVY
jgi:hypothetical protein